MSEKRVVMVVDMQNGVFETPRHQREKCVSLISQLTQAADKVIFIQHTEAGAFFPVGIYLGTHRCHFLAGGRRRMADAHHGSNGRGAD